MIFIDEAVLVVRAGRGGDGCVAFRREKYVPRGGPSGGNGGDGGSVVAVAAEGLNTLYHLRHCAALVAERGRHGEGSNRTGRSGNDLEVELPLGTLVHDSASGEPLGEILSVEDRLLLVRGGRGGRGNASFATSTRRAPRYAQSGEEGEEREIRCELKLLADAGVVGLPNAGKSTLISALTAARAKVADYPFTTLVPQLGVVAADDLERPFVIADLPGLIAGAAEGAGLGSRFLRHVERCRVLVHLVELSSGEGTAEQDLVTVEEELRAFGHGLLERPRLIVGSKLDAALSERRVELRAAAADRGLDYLEVSAVTHQELDRLVGALTRLLTQPEIVEA